MVPWGAAPPPSAARWQHGSHPTLLERHLTGTHSGKPRATCPPYPRKQLHGLPLGVGLEDLVAGKVPRGQDLLDLCVHKYKRNRSLGNYVMPASVTQQTNMAGGVSSAQDLLTSMLAAVTYPAACTVHQARVIIKHAPAHHSAWP